MIFIKILSCAIVFNIKITLVCGCPVWFSKFSMMCISTTLHISIMCGLRACNVCLLTVFKSQPLLFAFSALTFLQRTFPQANISTAATNPVITKGIGFLNYMSAWKGRGMLKMTCWTCFMSCMVFVWQPI